ncbi:MAG: DUF523 domain-containing protein [Candidatus Omnitrophota bacterium]
MKLCSACLLGIRCRFDGKSNAEKAIIELARTETLIPVCPEQLGGLSTPRDPAERLGNRVITKAGRDVTKEYRTGSLEVLKLTKIYNIKEAILKQGSPACGRGLICDGTFSGNAIKGNGVTAELLQKNGINIIAK